MKSPLCPNVAACRSTYTTRLIQLKWIYVFMICSTGLFMYVRSVQAQESPTIFITNGGGIFHYEMGISFPREVPGLVGIGPRTIAVDPEREKIYWMDGGTANIRRANLDGTEVESITPYSDEQGLTQPSGMALDLSGGKVYWTTESGNIFRAELDGTQIENLVTVDSPGAIAIDHERGKIYWPNRSSGNIILRANLDGSEIETAITTTSGIVSIAIDVGEGKIYWAEASNRILRANLDGTEVDTLLVEIFRPIEITLDTAQGKMYWSDPDAINRANLDGTDAERVKDSLFDTQGVALDLVNSKLYWVSNITLDPPITAIQRSNLDGSEPEVLTDQTIINNVRSIVIDEMAEKLYWADFTNRKIQRANFDGSEIEDLIEFDLPEDGSPFSIAIDQIGAKMYWMNSGAAKIQRANFDGSEREDLVSFPRFSALGGITLNTDEGKMYWGFEGEIQRSNLDGTEVEASIVTGLGNYIISLATDGSKLYWTDGFNIQRSNLDGSEIEPIAKNIRSYGIALDLENQKIYWTDDDTNTVRRANLDGKDVEVIADFYSPRAIAVKSSSPGAQSTEEVPHDLNTGHLNLSGYPNPFPTSTTIQYTLTAPQKVIVTVYDILGRTVSQLADAYQLAGHHEVVWDGLSLPAGAYFIHIATDSGYEEIQSVMKVGQ